MPPAAAAATRYAAMFAALGHEARVRIVRLLLAAHPDGLVAGEIQQELGIPASTLSHHLDALETAGLIDRKSTRLNSSHGYISYAVFCLKKKKKNTHDT